MVGLELWYNITYSKGSNEMSANVYFIKPFILSKPRSIGPNEINITRINLRIQLDNTRVLNSNEQRKIDVIYFPFQRDMTYMEID